MSDSGGSRLWLAGGVLLFLLVLLWCFQEVIIGGRLLSYRDSLHFYYPLFEYIQQQLEAGRLPLWNPYTSGGQPLLASPTASVLYPGKVVFFLPLSYWARYHLYVVLHIVIAGCTCGWTARRWGASRPASVLAGMSYAFSGNVLFQYCNVVYLCGAAWMPLALWAGDRMVQSRSWRTVPLFAVILALILLAGDAEMAYVGGVLAGLQGVLLWWQERKSRRVGNLPAARQNGGRSRFVVLGAAAGLTFLLAAAQILPTAEWSRGSIRASRKAPLSIYDLPKFWMQDEQFIRLDTQAPPDWYDSFIGNPPFPALHESLVYDFSFAPWRLVEFLWPNISGLRFPVLHSWMEILHWSGQPWSPSQYLGLLPVLLALAAWKVRGADSRRRWLSWILLLSAVASFGRYGPGQLFLWEPSAVELSYQAPFLLRRATGGLYWFLVTFLPGFAEFRYPSKLLVPATCAISLLAARGLDAIGGRRKWWSPVLLALSLASGLAAAMFWFYQPKFIDLLVRSHAGFDDTFEPEGACTDILWALGQTAVVASLGAVLFRGAGQTQPRERGDERRSSLRLTMIAWMIVLVTAVDLAVANRTLIATTDRSRWEQTPQIVSVLNESAARRELSEVRPLRVHRTYDWDYPLRKVLDRFDDASSVVWQRETLYGMQNLPYHIAYTIGRNSVESSEQEAWFDHLPLSLDPPRLLRPRRTFDAWGTQFFVVPDVNVEDPALAIRGLLNRWKDSDEQRNLNLAPLGEPLDGALPGNPQPLAGAPDAKVLYNESAFPPAWIVHRIRAIKPIPFDSRKRWVKLTSSMAFPIDEPIDLHREAFVESEDIVQKFGTLPVDWAPLPSVLDRCELTRYEPEQMEFEAELSATGLAVLSEMYTPDWKATVSKDGGPFESQPIYRTNRTMRGILLPAGKYVVRCEYQPRLFHVGAILSLASLSLVLAWFALQAFVRIRHRVTRAAA